MSNEKRSNMRHVLDQICEVYDVDSEQRMGRLANISSRGLMLQTHNSVEINRIYSVRFQLSDQSIVVGIDCLWCEPADHPDLFWAGFQIVCIAEEHERMLAELE